MEEIYKVLPEILTQNLPFCQDDSVSMCRLGAYSAA